MSGRPSPLTSTIRVPTSVAPVAIKIAGEFHAALSVHPFPLLIYAAWCKVPPESVYDWMISGKPSPFTSAILAPLSAPLELDVKTTGGFHVDVAIQPLPLFKYAEK